MPKLGADTKYIEVAIERSEKGHNPDSINTFSRKSLGIDSGFGFSPFGVCIIEFIDGMINVLHAEEYPRPDFNEMIDTTLSLIEKYNISFANKCRIFVDGANPSFIRALKDIVGEHSNYEQLITHYKREYPSVFDLQFLMQNMFVLPVHFSKEHKNMLAHGKEMLEYRNGNVTIYTKFTKLITALRTAVENGEGVLDKDMTSHDDLFDSFRLSLQFWHQIRL